ncbi:4-galactosyl-N-acetylglucosaminide 3-alpha-L-fucosyltransferase 9 [Drosophila mojavensis]|uniref:Fucosyltransferase n=1 Tax=Drosophila mojavensis TaxID=7230 RepID=B4L8W4_DROMO|nr:4-galactosyl-N-acetylglucosaminide 3-alpha-L-fucosyltransferase 9 [Drosophila mojavensis]EDW17139.2 uncharacterized protein Dmoj_GI16667 [Drosophila mojavensis]
MSADKIDSKTHKSEMHSQLLHVPAVKMVKDKSVPLGSEESKISNNSMVMNEHDSDRQKLFLYLTILKSVVCLAIILLMMRFIGHSSRRRLLLKRPSAKTILLWNTEQSPVPWEYLQCGCVLTNNREYAKGPIHAVVFNADRNFSLAGLERLNRVPNFLAVFAARNPLSFAHNPLLEHGASVFNYSMTYRRDSDIVFTDYYFSAVDKKHQTFADIDFNLLDLFSSELLSLFQLRVQKKQRLVFYMVYEVNEHSLPESLYLQKLRNYLQLDAFITCHGYQDCGQYKFMLIFEPSECPDFVHPQIYNALAHYVVPVIIGRGNVSGLIPPGSYISSADFETPEMLAMHLEKLSNDPLQYQRFFDWHSKYRIHKNRHPYCALCRQMHKLIQPVPSDKFLNWWTGYQCPNRTDVDLTRNEISAPSRNDFNYQSHWSR